MPLFRSTHRRVEPLSDAAAPGSGSSPDGRATHSTARHSTNRHSTARRHAVRGLAAGLLAAVGLSTAPLAQAATTFTSTAASATVSGSSVKVSVNIRASVGTTVTRYSVCVRNTSSGANLDYPYWSNAWIATSGTPYVYTKSFAAGTYRYFACVQVGSTWSAVGTPQTFTVGGGASSVTPSEPTGSSMPRGDLAGWRQVFAEDFTTTVGRGSFLSSTAYGSQWFGYSGYNDTSGRGTYDPAAVISTTGGVLDWYVRTENNQRKVAALVPKIPATSWGQQYGRYSLRYRADLIPGYKMAFMLWPDSDNWGEGEVDFPEVGSLSSGDKIYANMYARGNTSTRTPGATSGFRTSTDAAGSGWHTATIEWAPNSLTFYLDGTRLGTLTQGVPNTRFHLVLQVETAITGTVPSTSAGHVQVDWVTQYSYNP